MGYVCLHCNEIYKMNLPCCPKVSCSGEVVEIDDLMIPTIITLNEKGYITEFCCSGHAYEECCYPYIKFDNILNYSLNEEEFKELFKELPEPWYIDYEYANQQVCLRCKVENKNIIEAQRIICNANINLLEFVNTLPSLYDD